MFTGVHYLPPGVRLEELPDVTVDVFDDAVTNIEAARVRRFIRRLPLIERRVICWRYGVACEQLSVRKIAARLGMSVGTVFNIEQRALDRLRDHYTDEGLAA